MTSGFVILPIPRDVATAEETLLEVFQAQYGEEFRFEDTDPVSVLARGVALLYADVAYLATRMGEEAFRFLGRTVDGVLPIEDTPATGTVTFTAQDASGPYEVPEGTTVSGAGPTGAAVAFETVTTLTIANGQTTGSVAVEAAVEGAEGNGISGTAELEEYLDYIVSAVFDNPTAGGTDRETDRDYLDRLAEERQLASALPVKPEDFAAMARLLGAYRAVAIDGLNPNDGTTDNALTVAVALIDEAGEPDPDAADIAATLESLREQGFAVWPLDPTYTTVGVEYEVTAYPGWETAEVEAGVDDALAARLSPAYHGAREDTGEVREWLNRPVLRYLEVAEAIQRVEGVDYIDSLTLFLFREGFTNLDDVTIDAGGVTFTASGGQGTPTDVTEKRVHRTDLLTENARHTLKFNPGATIGATWNVGLILKRLDADDGLYVRVAEDMHLSIRKLVAGTPASISDDADSIGALATNSPRWLRGWIDGNDVTVEHWTTDPFLGGSPAVVHTHTLSGGDATTYGEGVEGNPGLRFVPGSTTWRLDDWTVDSAGQDIEMAGYAPLPRPGAIDGTVNAGTV